MVVTSSFRFEKQRVTGSIVKPSKISNHLSGHAIDMNLRTPHGFCNSSCLRRESNKYAKCFTDWVKNHNQLRWGNSFNDPVHIDDGINLRDRAKWDNHFYDNQSC